MRREDVTAIVLCGGSAARLGTVDKTLLPVAGRALVEYTVEALAPQVGEIVLSCGRDPAAYEAFGYRVVSDRDSGHGPLGGIVSALPLVESEWILTHPGDTPFPDPALVERLAEAATDTGLAVPRTGDYRQHLVMLLTRERAEELVAFYGRNGRAVKDWLDGTDVVELDMSDLGDSFFNVNTPDDLAAAERRAVGRAR